MAKLPENYNHGPTPRPSVVRYGAQWGFTDELASRLRPAAAQSRVGQLVSDLFTAAGEDGRVLDLRTLELRVDQSATPTYNMRVTALTLPEENGEPLPFATPHNHN